MAEQAVSAYTPVETPIPPAPNSSFFSDAQWKTLFALADAIVPSIRTAATAKSSTDKVISIAEWDDAVSKLSSLITGHDSVAIATRYLEEDVSSNPTFRAYVERIIGNHEGKAGFGLILNALKYVIGDAGNADMTPPTDLDAALELDH